MYAESDGRSLWNRPTTRFGLQKRIFFYPYTADFICLHLVLIVVLRIKYLYGIGLTDW